MLIALFHDLGVLAILANLCTVRMVLVTIVNEQKVLTLP
jgi:hypothetical protein